MEEVEGSIRQGGGDAGQKVVPPKSGEDIAAFRKLVSYLSSVSSHFARCLYVFLVYSCVFVVAAIADNC